jgi:hypothetical protein
MIKPGPRKERGKCPLCGHNLVNIAGITRCSDQRHCSFVESHYHHDSVKRADRKAEKKVVRKKPAKKPGKPISPEERGEIDKRIEAIRSMISKGEVPEEDEVAGEMTERRGP